MKSETEFGATVRRAREDAGMSLVDVVVELRRLLPESMWVSTAGISRLETGTTAEEKADPFLVGVLARIYGVEAGDLSPVVAEELAQAQEALRQRNAWLASQP